MNDLGRMQCANSICKYAASQVLSAYVMGGRDVHWLLTPWWQTEKDATPRVRGLYIYIYIYIYIYMFISNSMALRLIID